MTLLDRPGLRVLPTLAVLALGCSVGDTGESFTGGSLTFGGGNTSAEAGGPDADTADESQGDDTATSGMTSGNDSADGCTPSEETCNGQDDDCDGVADDGNPGGGAACNTGLPGICGPGTQACQGGALVCNQNVGAGAEVCGNGLDDDCDGMVDEGCGGCPFGLCESPGLPQVNGCDPCVTSVCAVDAFCCSNSWDGICVGQVETVCGRADCVSASCAHLVCDTGVALTVGCHPCVDSICAADPFCCSNSWDGLCVGAVGTVCGLTCP